MPIYEYRCKACGHTLDALQKISDAPLEECPECGKPSLKRLVSAPAFRLKGSGWYETDFKSDKEKRRNLADGGKKSETAKSSESSKSPESGKSSSASSGSTKGDAGKGSATKDSASSSGPAPA